MKSNFKKLSIAFILPILSIFVFQACNLKKNTSNENVASKPVVTLSDYVQIATGQVVLYNNNGEIVNELNPGDKLYGQDAIYLNGKKMSFTKNGNGTVSDDNTGLMWQEMPTSEGFDWQDAYDYCENLELGGYNDWRMPSAKELFSISDFSEGWPYIDLNYFSLVNNEVIEKSEQYWTTNKYVGHTSKGQYNAAFGVNHATGHIKAYPALEPKDMNNQKDTDSRKMPPPPGGNNGMKPKGNPMLKHVRAVRGEVYGINDFQDNGNGTISDKSSGLMWSKNDSEKGLDWENALSYAENSELAGYSDWRLPNVKELQGIVNYSYAPNAKDSENKRPAIDPVFNCTVITNEANNKDYPYYWTSTSARFQKGKPCYYAWYVAFGRAVGPEGKDLHGAGAVRFDTKYEGGPAGEGGERYYNYVRLVRNIK